MNPGRSEQAPGDVRAAHTSNGRLLDADDLGARWKVSRAHVYRLAREGRIPTVRIGRYYRFRLDAIEAWERAQEEPTR